MSPRHQKKKRGAQPGNQNARKHGYYSKVLTPEQQQVIPVTPAVRNLDQEIPVLRVKIASIMKNDPFNYALLLRALSLLTCMLNSRQIPETSALQELTDVPHDYPGRPVLPVLSIAEGSHDEGFVSNY